MSDRADRLVLELTWVLDAPREQIFRALSEPAALARWWGPSGFTTPQIELDLRVGGGFRFGMQPPDGDLFHLTGEFLEVDRPRRLAYTFRWEEPDPDDRETVVTLSLDPLDDATKVALSHGDFATESRLALHRAGWTESFVKLRELLAPDTWAGGASGTALPRARGEGWYGAGATAALGACRPIQEDEVCSTNGGGASPVR